MRRPRTDAAPLVVDAVAVPYVGRPGATVPYSRRTTVRDQSVLGFVHVRSIPPATGVATTLLTRAGSVTSAAARSAMVPRSAGVPPSQCCSKSTRRRSSCRPAG